MNLSSNKLTNTIHQMFLTMGILTSLNPSEFRNETRPAKHAMFGKFNSSAFSEHLTSCEHAKHIHDLHNLYENVNGLKPHKTITDKELVVKNTKILHSLLQL